MPSFENFADMAIPSLCENCPLKAQSARIEMLRLEVSMGAIAEDVATAAEADLAASLVLASVYGSRHGCAGALHNEDGACGHCGNVSTCAALEEVNDLIFEDLE